MIKVSFHRIRFTWLLCLGGMRGYIPVYFGRPNWNRDFSALGGSEAVIADAYDSENGHVMGDEGKRRHFGSYRLYYFRALRVRKNLLYKINCVQPSRFHLGKKCH